eukprot:NODE_469_length_7049_cov_0.468489.p2 type:complete len:335 gc:universal NODE_469_length_7049_cov_0.468489:5382-6386(+)
MFHLLALLGLIASTYISSTDVVDTVVRTLLQHSVIYIFIAYIHKHLRFLPTFYLIILWPLFTFLYLLDHVLPVLQMIVPSLFFIYNLCILFLGLCFWRIIEINSTSNLRKIFHLMCLALFIFDYYFIKFFILSITIVYYLMLILEFTRYSAIVIPSNTHLRWLRSYSLNFSNDLKSILYAHEQNSLISSHMELLVGCGIGFYIEYLFYFPLHYPLAHAGLACIGVGDSCASWFGQYSFKLLNTHLHSKYQNKLYWPYSKKTILGSCAFFFSTLFAQWLISSMMGIYNINWAIFIVSTFLATIMEIYTKHDNILSPLIFYSSYHSVISLNEFINL